MASEKQKQGTAAVGSGDLLGHRFVNFLMPLPQVTIEMFFDQIEFFPGLDKLLPDEWRDYQANRLQSHPVDGSISAKDSQNQPNILELPTVKENARAFQNEDTARQSVEKSSASNQECFQEQVLWRAALLHMKTYIQTQSDQWLEYRAWLRGLT